MPGLNGTGPEGMGPMTGGARGLCTPQGRANARSGAWTGFGRGPGRGRGYGFRYRAGGAPGWGRRRAAGPMSFPDSVPYSREQEMGVLKDEASALKHELNAIDQRIRELESKDKSSD